MRRNLLTVVVLVLSLIAMGCGFLMLDLSCRTAYLWQYRDRYVAGEFVVDQLVSDNEGLRLLGRARIPPGSFRPDAAGSQLAAATRGQLRGDMLEIEELTWFIPSELHTFAGPGDMVGKLAAQEEIGGRRFPIWYDPGTTHWSVDTRMVFTSEWPTLPDGQDVLTVAAINLAVVVVAAGGLWWGGRRWMRASTQPSNSD